MGVNGWQQYLVGLVAIIGRWVGANEALVGFGVCVLPFAGNSGEPPEEPLCTASTNKYNYKYRYRYKYGYEYRIQMQVNCAKMYRMGTVLH